MDANSDRASDEHLDKPIKVEFKLHQFNDRLAADVTSGKEVTFLNGTVEFMSKTLSDRFDRSVICLPAKNPVASPTF